MEYPEFQTGIFGRMESAHAWTPVKEDKLVAAWQCHECLFNITSCNYSNRGMKEKAWQEIATEVEMPGKQNENVCVFFL